MPCSQAFPVLVGDAVLWFLGLWHPVQMLVQGRSASFLWTALLGKRFQCGRAHGLCMGVLASTLSGAVLGSAPPPSAEHIWCGAFRLVIFARGGWFPCSFLPCAVRFRKSRVRLSKLHTFRKHEASNGKFKRPQMNSVLGSEVRGEKN